MTGDARRLVHAASAAVPLLGLWQGWSLARQTVIALLALALLLEWARHRGPRVQQVVTDLGRRLLRPTEATGITGATWLALGFALALLAPPRAAALGMLVAALADPAGGFVGSRWGRRPTAEGRTWEGTVAVALAAAITAWVVDGQPVLALAVAATAALIERCAAPLDDNLVLAPGVALVAWALA